MELLCSVPACRPRCRPLVEQKVTSCLRSVVLQSGAPLAELQSCSLLWASVTAAPSQSRVLLQKLGLLLAPRKSITLP